MRINKANIATKLSPGYLIDNHVRVKVYNDKNAFGKRRQIYHEDGLYEYLLDKQFIEILGEYYQEDAEAGEEIPETQVAQINKTKKRIITYKLYQ